MEGAVPKQCHEAEFAEPLTVVFNGLIEGLARHRWAEGLDHGSGPPIPKVGCRYANRRGKVLRLGRVLECLRPVALTLYETLFDPPCRVRLELRWRLEPIESGCLLRVRVRYQLNGAAQFRRRHWNGQIHAHCERMLGFARAAVRRAREAHGEAGVNGHSTGNSSIAVTKTMSVSGTPSLR